MNRYAFLCIACILLLVNCAVQKEPASSRPPKRLITKVEGDVKRKPLKKKPVEVDYQKEGVTVQSIEIIKKEGPAEFNQRRFIENASYASLDDIKLQYEKGARVNFRNDNNETVLINIIKGAFDNETFLKLEYLVSVGAAVNFRGRSKTSNLTTPLDAAVYYSSSVFKEDTVSDKPYYAEKIIRYLIEAGANVSGTDVKGRSPLHTAAREDNSVAARILLEAGAGVAAKDYDGKTPLDYAVSDQMTRLLQEYSAPDMKEPVPAEVDKQK
ncbi:MAG: ankyrin repeat domain-containing protein [Deltaproteobacteria bacterium]|jgi:ankyrin repeat protein|nr:ankyrin repeat domain-containing protein [Deltaproteobacteria bacterium]